MTLSCTYTVGKADAISRAAAGFAGEPLPAVCIGRFRLCLAGGGPGTALHKFMDSEIRPIMHQLKSGAVTNSGIAFSFL
jgi:hypothetical protein